MRHQTIKMTYLLITKNVLTRSTRISSAWQVFGHLPSIGHIKCVLWIQSKLSNHQSNNSYYGELRFSGIISMTKRGDIFPPKPNCDCHVVKHLDSSTGSHEYMSNVMPIQPGDHRDLLLAQVEKSRKYPKSLAYFYKNPIWAQTFQSTSKLKCTLENAK